MENALLHLCVDIHNTWECKNYTCTYVHTFIQYSTLYSVTCTFSSYVDVRM